MKHPLMQKVSKLPYVVFQIAIEHWNWELEAMSLSIFAHTFSNDWIGTNFSAPYSIRLTYSFVLYFIYTYKNKIEAIWRTYK